MDVLDRKIEGNKMFADIINAILFIHRKDSSRIEGQDWKVYRVGKLIRIDIKDEK